MELKQTEDVQVSANSDCQERCMTREVKQRVKVAW